ncbi:MAG: FAD:protein FMN transferase [Verrucomicrobiota bacterium]|nr:FAD:protein FMN transferase [Verrucomicrobiota bacterium]
MTPWSKRRALLGLLCCILPCPPLLANDWQRHEFSQPCMGTLFRIVVYSDKPDKEVAAATRAAFAIGTRMDSVFSDYQAESEVSRFNHSTPRKALPASPELMELLNLSRKLHEETGGRFDPACGALSRLWRISRRSGKLPVPAILDAARETSGLRQLQIDPGKATISRLHPGTRLDFGAIAKGHAADRMLQSLRGAGLASASVTAGGDVAAGEAPPGKTGWKVAIRPRGDESPPAFLIRISNASVSTSGNVEQAIEIDGVLYSHIIDLETGLGLRTRHAAAVITRHCSRSDALATALCIAGKNGLDMIRALPATEAALFVGGVGEKSTLQTEGFAAFITRK